MKPVYLGHPVYIVYHETSISRTPCISICYFIMNLILKYSLQNRLGSSPVNILVFYFLCFNFIDNIYLLNTFYSENLLIN